MKNFPTGFIAVQLGLLFFISLSINIDVVQYLQSKKIGLPTYFSLLPLLFSAGVLGSWLLIFMKKKMGIYLFPIFLLGHFGVYQFYLSTFLYSDVFLLFIYISIGMLVWIPIWDNFFK